MRDRSRCCLLLAASLVVGLTDARLARAEAETYPSHPIQVIVSYPAGGAYDSATRILAPQMSKLLGQPLVIIPKPGASGSLGVGYVLSSPSDGYTLSSTATASLTLNPLYMDQLTYTSKDAIPIGTFAVEVNAVIVKADAKWKTFEELLGDAAVNPGKLTCATPGAGSVSTTVMDVIKAERGLNIVNVPFLGSPPVNVAVLGGQVDFGTLTLTTAAPMVQSGQLRLLAVGGTRRSPLFPDIKTFKELGFKAADLQLKIGLFVNSKTPPAVVSKLSEAFDRTVADPEVAAQLTKMGLLPQSEDAKTAQAALIQEEKDVGEIGKLLNIGR